MDCPQTAPSHLTTTNTANSPTSSATNGQLTSTLTLNGSLWDAAEAVVLSSDDWRHWPRQANGSHNGDYTLFFPAGWQCALTFTNGSGSTLTGANLSLEFDGGDHLEQDTLPLGPLPPGTTTTVTLPPAGRRIDSANAQQAYLSLHLTGADGLADATDWNLRFYLRNDGGYRVFQELSPP